MCKSPKLHCATKATVCIWQSLTFVHRKLQGYASSVAHAVKKVLPLRLDWIVFEPNNRKWHHMLNRGTFWVHSVVIIKKPDGNLRIYMVSKELNENIKREHFHLPTWTTQWSCSLMVPPDSGKYILKRQVPK